VIRALMASLVATVVLAFASPANAQGAPKEHSMTGCLKAGPSPNSYMVTDLEGTGAKSIGIVSSTPQLAPHVGHKIQVTGTAVAPADAEKDPNIPKAPHYMKLTAIKMISATCP
jgi:hypothetical protein